MKRVRCVSRFIGVGMSLCSSRICFKDYPYPFWIGLPLFLCGYISGISVFLMDFFSIVIFFNLRCFDNLVVGILHMHAHIDHWLLVSIGIRENK